MAMRVIPGRVEGGKIIPESDVPLSEGTTVTVIIDSPEESFSLPSKQEAQLLDAIDDVDRGEVIHARDLLSRLKARARGRVRSSSAGR
jgi:hypothetical protein